MLPLMLGPKGQASLPFVTLGSKVGELGREAGELGGWGHKGQTPASPLLAQKSGMVVAR